MKKIHIITFVVILFLTIGILLSFFWNVSTAEKNMHLVVKSQGEAFFSEIITTRAWNAGHGGVYVPVNESLQPNPYLDVPNRDVYTTDSVLLTKVNPAFMTRLIAEIAFKKEGIHYHITSLKPIRPANIADSWETNALESFEQGETEYFELVKEDTVFKYMAALPVNEVCMKCHAKQGYQVGDIRGGISINIPAQKSLTALEKQKNQLLLLHIFIFVFTLIFTIVFMRIISKQILKIKEKNIELQSQKEEILAQSDVLTEKNKTIQKTNEELKQNYEEIHAQKEEINNQKELLSEQNELMSASIRYARTIQEASLPFAYTIDKIYANFIYYRPKAIVSGDFYWFAEKKDFNFMVVADCTGHGVPGAFMSMIGIRLLNLIVNERGITEPADILSELNKGIIKSLKQNISKNIDGMDVCLCRIDKNFIEKTKRIVFAGAKRPLLYFSRNDNKIIRFKGCKETIGGIYTKKVILFNQTEFEVMKGDLIYLTTDGYQDQNGPGVIRIGIKGVVELIDKYKHLPLHVQKENFESFMNNHQQHYMQRDDMTIIALQI